MEKITHIVFDNDGTLVDTSGYKRFLYPEIENLLKFLHENDVKMFVWTARTSISAKEILEDLGVLQYFQEICGGNDAPGKPGPEGLYHLLPAVNPQNVVVIGDSLGDIIGGSKFGAHCIGAMWGHGDISASRLYAERGAKASFLKIDELKEYLKKLIRGE